MFKTSSARTELLEAAGHWGCQCGAGRAALLLRFAIEADASTDAIAVTLLSAELRVVHGLTDLADVDFVVARSESLAPTWSRDEAIASVLYWSFGVDAPPSG